MNIYAVSSVICFSLNPFSYIPTWFSIILNSTAHQGPKGYCDSSLWFWQRRMKFVLIYIRKETFAFLTYGLTKGVKIDQLAIHRAASKCCCIIPYGRITRHVLTTMIKRIRHSPGNIRWLNNTEGWFVRSQWQKRIKWKTGRGRVGGRSFYPLGKLTFLLRFTWYV